MKVSQRIKGRGILVKNFLLLCKMYTGLLSILILNISCESGKEKFLTWISENQGQKFTEDHMNYLISEFGKPIDTVIGSEMELTGFSTFYFYGPFFEIDEGKKLKEKASKEWKDTSERLARYFERTGKEQGLAEGYRFTSMNSNWHKYHEAVDKYNSKYSKIYEDKAKGRTFTLNELLKAYQVKFPELSKDQCIENLESGLNERYELDIRDLRKIKYRFKVDNAAPYVGTVVEDNEQKNFNVVKYEEVVVLDDGTIENYKYSGGYCLTEDSRKDLTDHVVGDWVYELSGDMLGAYKFSSDGTYSYSSKMFNIMGVRGEWWLTCDGEVRCSTQNSVLKITKSGLRSGETLYTRY